MRRLLLTGLLALPGCRPTAPAEPVFRNAAHPLPGRIWQRGDLQLVAGGDLPLQSKDGRRLYMADLPPERLPAYLQPNVMARHDSFHLLSLDPFETGALAALTHSSGGALPCGRLEQLRPAFLPAATTLTPPVYNALAAPAQIRRLTGAVDQERIRATIAILEALNTRYHNLPGGSEAVTVIAGLLRSAGEGLPRFSVETVTHAGTPQASVVARLEGALEPEKVLILGAHLDSINRSDQSQAPGADDNASGIADLVETVRVLATIGAVFDRTVEIHAYGAEEIGLIGSGDLAQTYRDRNTEVVAMMQLDMTAWSQDPQERTLWLVENDTHPALRETAARLVRLYTGAKAAFGRLSAGTSDHRSWYVQGYPTVFPFENPDGFNTRLHTADDTLNHINNLTLAAEFTRLSIAWIAHYAGLRGPDDYADRLQDALDGVSGDISVALIPDPDGSDDTIWAAAGGHQLAEVQICPVLRATDAGCRDHLYRLTPAGVRGGRRFFLNTTAITATAGQGWRLEAFDAQHRLIARRHIRLAGR